MNSFMDIEKIHEFINYDILQQCNKGRNVKAFFWGFLEERVRYNPICILSDSYLIFVILPQEESYLSFVIISHCL